MGPVEFVAGLTAVPVEVLDEGAKPLALPTGATIASTDGYPYLPVK